SFFKLWGSIRKQMVRWLEKQSQVADSVGRFITQEERRIARIREDGGEEANRYILDGEALQMENGRRLWDFYFADRIRDLGSLKMSTPKIQRILSDMSRNQEEPLFAVQGAYNRLYKHAEGEITPKINGNLESEDKATQDGLTIEEALKLEIEYRSLYLSHAKEVQANGAREVRRLIAGYRSQSKARQIDVHDDKYMDYMRDKFKRIINEKANMLCYYDESRESQGGVRADKVKLIAIREDFKHGLLSKVIERADPNFKMVSEDWHSPRSIVFYRAVLNVPLYVFGRMDRMRDYYYRFKNMAKRSKILHIDQNWEGTLLDLDPVSAQNEHKRKMVLANIIQFSSLLSLHLTIKGSNGKPKTAPYIDRRDEAYYLRPPQQGKNANKELMEDDWIFLGKTMGEAIRALPGILKERPVRYMLYQQVIDAIMKGYSPTALKEVVNLPFRWRNSYDELKSQYGAAPNVNQQILLNDFKDAYNLLSEALLKTLATLRDKKKEEETLTFDNQAGKEKPNWTKQIVGSIQILEAFEEEWDAILNPKFNAEDEMGDLAHIFSAIEEKDLSQIIKNIGEI
ncbi:MAG: hypothetical protein VX278_13695, partial [Myxococcota bacterium]|nr:hypothetical protein [Myxococcota bacterium]